MYSNFHLKLCMIWSTSLIPMPLLKEFLPSTLLKPPKIFRKKSRPLEPPGGRVVVLSSGNSVVVVSDAFTVVVHVVLGVIWFCVPASWIHVSKICLIQGSDINIESITAINQLLGAAMPRSSQPCTANSATDLCPPGGGSPWSRRRRRSCHG